LSCRKKSRKRKKPEIRRPKNHNAKRGNNDNEKIIGKAEIRHRQLSCVADVGTHPGWWKQTGERRTRIMRIGFVGKGEFCLSPEKGRENMLEVPHEGEGLAIPEYGESADETKGEHKVPMLPPENTIYFQRKT